METSPFHTQHNASSANVPQARSRHAGKAASVTAAVLLALLAVGCNRTPAPEPGPEAAPAPVTEQAAAEPAPVVADAANCDFCAVPAEVKVCEVHEGKRTQLSWHLSDQGVAVVDIYVVDEAGKEQQFAEQAADGTIETGPWLRPGLVFRIKDHKDGRQLAELTIAGRDC